MIVLRRPTESPGRSGHNMIGFQPYETFQLLIETGGIDRTNTLLCAACDAFARRGRPTSAEMEQFAALAQRLFPAAAPAARAKAAATLGRSENLSPELEELVVRYLGDDLGDFLVNAPKLSEETMLKVISANDVMLGAALARRSDLSAAELAKLFQMNSRKVYRALATNTAIVPRGPYLSALARSAQMDHQVAWSLAARDDFDAALLAPAFFDLGETDRIKVISAFAERQTPAAPIRRTRIFMRPCMETKKTSPRRCTSMGFGPGGRNPAGAKRRPEIQLKRAGCSRRRARPSCRRCSR